jgi:hypothetical protein
MRLIDYIVQYMQDGTPRRLVHIAQAVKAMGYQASISTQYLGVYQTLMDNPTLFKRVGVGMYQLIKSNAVMVNKDQDYIKTMIVDLLRKYPRQLPVHVWGHLQDEGVVVAYSTVQYILDSDSFIQDRQSRYSNRK